MIIDTCADNTNNDNENDTISCSTASDLGLTTYSTAQFLAAPATQKTGILASLLNSPTFNSADIRKLTSLHFGVTAYVSKGKRKLLKQLHVNFSSHICTSFCLIRCEHVGFAGFSQSSFETLSEHDFLACAKVLKLRLTSPTAAVNKRKNVSFADSPLPQKKTCLLTSSQAGESVQPSTDTYNEIPDPCEILPTFEKIKIIEEYCDATSNNAFRRYECSFCDSLQPLNSFFQRFQWVD